MDDIREDWSTELNKLTSEQKEKIYAEDGRLIFTNKKAQLRFLSMMSVLAVLPLCSLLQPLYVEL